MDNESKKLIVSLLKCVCIVILIFGAFKIFNAMLNDFSNSLKSDSTNAPYSRNTNDPNNSESTPTHVKSYEIGTWEVSFINANFQKSISSGFLTEFKAEEGSQFLVIKLKVTNKSKKMNTFLPAFSVGNDVNVKVFHDEYTFSASNLIGLSNDLHYTYLNPLESKEGIIAFSIPEDIIQKGNLVFVITSGQNDLTFTIA